MADDSDAIWKPAPTADDTTSSASTRLERPRSEPDDDDPTSGDSTRLKHPNSGEESPWSPDADVAFAPVLAAVFDTPESAEPDEGTSQETSPVDARRRMRVVVLLAGVVGLLLGAVAVTRLVAGNAPAGGVALSQPRYADGIAGVPVVAPIVAEPFAGADRRWLPDALDLRWSSVVAGVEPTSRTQLVVGPGGTVIGLFADAAASDDRGASLIVGLDADSGDEIWRTPFDSEVRAFTVLGMFRGVVVLERLDTDNRSVVGISIDSGAVLWERETNDPGVHVALTGSEIVARVSFTGSPRLTFIDPVDGEEVARVPGRLFATDLLGTWYVRNENSVLTLDLSDGWKAPDPSHRIAVDDRSDITVVDDRLLELDRSVVQVSGPVLRADSIGTSLETIADERSPFEISSSAGVALPSSFQQIIPIVDDAFMLRGDNAMFGAVLGDDGIDVRWRADGAVIDTAPTDRGLTLLLGSDGGGTQQVVDASTGRVIVQVSMVPGAIDTLEMVGNGVVIKQAALVGFERVGLDLDGNRLWSLVGDGPLAIGPGVVVTYGPSDDGLAVTAYGDAAA